MKNHCELHIPPCLLLDAGILPGTQLAAVVDEGRIIIEPDEFGIEEAWEDYEQDELLSQVPDELRRFCIELCISPDVVRDFVMEGGLEF